MGKSWSAVPIETFASLCDKHGTKKGELESRKYFHTSTEVDTNLRVDSSIIGHSLDHLQRCLLMFAMTLAVVFDLRPCITVALKGVIERYMTFIGPHHAGPQDPVSGRMCQRIATDCQTELNKAYMRVYGEVTKSTDAFTDALDSIPDTSTSSQLSIDILLLRLATQKDIPPRNDNADNTRVPKRRNGRDDKQTVNAGTANTGPPPPSNIGTQVAQKNMICGYYLSDKGCQTQKHPCRREHRAPKTEAEKKAAALFFTQRPTTHKQIIF